MISEEYKNLTYLEENNLKHEIKVFNVTKNMELTDYLEIDDLQINKFLENESSSISPNALNLTFLLRKREKEKIPDYFDEVEGVFDNENFFDNIEDVRDYLVTENDEIRVIDIFNNERIDLFVGIAKELSLREELLHKYLRLTVKDKTINGYSMRFDKDYVYKDYYIYNKNEKNRSLLYILAKKLGFEDDKIEIEEIKHSLGDYITVPVAKFEKDNNIMQEMAELVRATVGNIYVKNDGTLKITSLINQKDTEIVDYTLQKGNILEYLESYDLVSVQNKVEVSYTENKVENRQVVFALAGQNASAELDDARVIVRANTVQNDIFWAIEYVTTNVKNLEKTPEVVAYKMNGQTKEYINYKDYLLELEDTNGKVKFLNPNNFDIFIEKFKLYGEPIFEYSGSSTTYTEKILQEHEIELKSIDNKYIQELRLAQSVAKYSYFMNCRDYKKYKLICNSVPFLELEDVIKLKYGEIDKQVQIISIVQHADKTELELKEFEVFEPNASRFETQKTNMLDKNLLKNGGTVDFGRIKYPDTKPPAPIGLTAEHQFLGFGLRWQALESMDIKGYLMYIKSINEDTGEPNGILDTKISCGNATYKVVKAEVGTYEVYITALNMNGIEGEKSQTVVARSLKVDGTQMNVDNDSLVIDTTGGKKLVLGTVYTKNLGANSVTANAIAANAIDTKHLNANSVTTEKINFSENDGLYKDNTGGILVKGDKLTITARTVFDNDVSLNGKIIGQNGIVVEHENRRTTIRGGTIYFEERNNAGQYIQTRTFRKMATGVYGYNPANIQWIDVRHYTGNIDWNNVRVNASLTRFNVDTNVRMILCEVVRHPHDRHLFYVRVGGVNVVEQGWQMVADNNYTWDRNYTPPVVGGSWNSAAYLQEGTFGSAIVVQDLYYNGISKMRVEFSNNNKKLMHEYEEWRERRNTSSHLQSYSYITYNMVYRVRHKPAGSPHWSDWQYYTSNNFDGLNQGVKYDINIQMVVVNFTINKNSNGATWGGIISRNGNSIWYDTRGNGNLKVWVSTSTEGNIAGGEATWWAYED